MPFLRSVVISVLVMLASLELGAQALAAPPPPPISYQQGVVQTLVDKNGAEVLLRRGWHLGGSTGFGWDKIHFKHGIEHPEIVAAVLRSPQVDRQEGANRWVYEKEALLMGLFTVEDRVTVRVVVEYGGWVGPGRLGVVTGYCVGYLGKCPSWVNTAFAVD